MKNVYQRTNWIDGKTPVNAENLNKIEGALEELYGGSVGISQLKKGKGVDIKLNDFREVEFSANPKEINELVEHNKYIEGSGIIMKDTTPPPFPTIPNPDTTIDDYWEVDDPSFIQDKPLPPLHPPTEISIDEDYVNEIVKHNKYIGSEGVIVEKIEEEEPVEGEDGEDLVKDKYSVKADIDYIDENITHPNYIGIRGVKVRKFELEQLFPELEIDERTKAVYLDEDYLNDYAIDIQKIAEKLNITPIVEYSAGEGLVIVDTETPEESNEIVEPAEPSETNQEENSNQEENQHREDQTEQEAVLEDLVNEQIGEPHQNVPEKIYKTIRLDEEWLDEKLANHDPEFNSDPSTGLSITKSEIEEGEEIPESSQYDVNINKRKLQEFLEVPASPEITGAANSGITVSKQLQPSPEEGAEYIPIPDHFTIGIDPSELREAINVEDNPTLTTNNGITLDITETSDSFGGTKENWTLGLDTEYVNSIVRHKQYTFVGPYFSYREIDANRGEISINETYLTNKIKEIVNQTLTEKGLI